jgi:glycosyltransferase involved in cell wall biosynthesis
MTVSVAMCTYNGEKFLKQQLDSILNQTIAVDEIIICDDGSTDDTIKIINEYATRFSNLKLIENLVNLKSVKNFEKAISLCTNDLIFLCDQDDLWIPEKVSIYVNAFSSNLDKVAFFSNGHLIDEFDKTRDQKTVWDLPMIFKHEGIAFDFHTVITQIDNIVTGASLALRKSFLDQVLPFPVVENYHHDEWIATNASIDGKLGYIETKCFLYRLHEDQQVGGVILTNFEKKKLFYLDYFSFLTRNKSFVFYKITLKRLVNAQIKNQQLYEISKKTLFLENAKLSAKTFLNLQTEFRRSYPMLSKLLAMSDFFTKKRRL